MLIQLLRYIAAVLGDAAAAEPAAAGFPFVFRAMGGVRPLL